MKKAYFYLISSLFVLLVPVLGFGATTPEITSVSSDWLSVVKRSQENFSTIAIYGDNFSDLIFNDNVNIYLGDFQGLNVAGNNEAINATFYFDKNNAPDGTYYLSVKEGDDVIYQSDIPIRIFNPYGAKYQKPKLKKFFKNTKNKKVSKRTVGLNVHQTMAGDSANDPEYQDKLENSKTKWAREHFSHQLIMGSEQSGWVTRYDKIMQEYDNDNIRVVGMLAYDKNQNYTKPSIGAWKKYVRYTVRRYRNYVDVWEIWNEPDSDEYLNPNTISEYAPLLKSASKIIRHYDPNSKVLNGGIADISKVNYIDNLYEYHKYFDALNIHLYYCGEYVLNGNNNAQREAMETLEETIFKGKRKKKVWITEIGCSLGATGVNQNTQRDYLRKSSSYLLKRGYVQNILLYTTRDRDLSDKYEAYFGLMDLDFQNRKAWKWYRKVPRK